MTELLRLTNVEPEGRKLAVLYERKGLMETTVLEPGGSMDLTSDDRLVSCKALPRHLGISIDTLHMGVDMKAFT